MNMLLVIHLIFSGDDSLQNCRDRGRSENLGAVIIPPPPVEIELTDLPKYGRGVVRPPPLSTMPESTYFLQATSSLLRCNCSQFLSFLLQARYQYSLS